MADPALPPLAAAPRTINGLAHAARLGVIATDAVVIAGAMAVAYVVALSGSLEGVNAYGYVSLVSLPLWLVVFHRYSLYHSRHVASRRLEFGRVLHAVGLGVLVTALVAQSLGEIVALRWLVTVFALTSVAVMAERIAVRSAFTRLRRRGYFVRRVVVVGTGDEAVALVAMVNAHPELGYRVVGLLGAGHAVQPRLAQLPFLDSGTDPVEQLGGLGAGGVLIATTEVGVETSNRLVRKLTDAGIHVELSSSLTDIDAERVSVRSLKGFTMMYVEAVKRGGWRPAAKRTFDIVVASLIMLLAAPVMGLVAVAIKATSPGPVLFFQERMGWRGRPFQILKLRSMYVDGEARLGAKNLLDFPAGPVVKLRSDPRVTPIGRLLRKLSIDEVPQLLNVLRGEMSLVGPRPEQPSEAVLWTTEQSSRLRVRPGLTGLWQVNGRSSARDTKDRLDLYYVDNWSIWHDTAIMLKTFVVVLTANGAY